MLFTAAQCTAQYTITTMGVTGTEPAVEDAFQGVPFLPALEPGGMKSFLLQTTVNVRILLTSSPQIMAGDDYLQIGKLKQMTSLFIRDVALERTE